MTSCWKVIGPNVWRSCLQMKPLNLRWKIQKTLNLLPLFWWPLKAKGDVIAFIDCHCAPQDQWHKEQIAAVSWLGGGFKYFLFSPLPGEMIQFDYSNIFQMGWNHQLDDVSCELSCLKTSCCGKRCRWILLILQYTKIAGNFQGFPRVHVFCFWECCKIFQLYRMIDG